MSKIIKAINAMISKPDEITNVMEKSEGATNFFENTEYYFLYKNKYKWSISKENEGNYFLHYYPGKQTLNELASYNSVVWQRFNNYLTYRTDDFGTKEALESFSELFSIIIDKLYRMDDVFDDIIDDDLF